MIIDYDKAANLTIDQKLQSLIDSIQRALQEKDTEIQELRKKIEKLQEEN